MHLHPLTLSILLLAVLPTYAITDPRSSTFAARADSTEDPTEPPPNLAPAIAHFHNVYDYNNLVPTWDDKLYYTDGGISDTSKEHFYASLNVTFHYPVVVGEHSCYISTVSCEPTGLDVYFNDLPAFEYAASRWNMSFVFVTHSLNCNAVVPGQRTYWLVKGDRWTKNELHVHLIASEIEIEEAMQSVSLEWGHYEPPKNSSGPASFNGTSTKIGSSSTSPKAGSGASSTVDGSVAASTVAGTTRSSSSSSSSDPPLQTGSPTVTPTSGGFFSDPVGKSGTATAASPWATNTVDCNPPAPSMLGFPAVFYCGEYLGVNDFDVRLDERIGFYNFTDVDYSPDTLKTFIPGVSDLNEVDYDAKANETKIFRRRAVGTRGVHLRKRFFLSPKSLIRRAVAATLNFVRTNIVPVVNKVIQYRIYQSKELKSKSGAATASLGLFCVDCGIKGNLLIDGRLVFQLSPTGITEGRLLLAGNLAATLKLGLAAEAAYANQFKTQLITVPIGGFTVFQLITVGPRVKTDAILALNITAEGSILAGGVVSLPRMYANIDVVTRTVDASGFEPVFTPVFEAKGEINAAASLALPIALGVGIDLIPLKERGHYMISLITTPSLTLTGTYSYEYEFESRSLAEGSSPLPSLPPRDWTPAPRAHIPDLAPRADENNCTGVAWQIDIKDDTILDIFGLKEINLFEFKKEKIASGCILAKKAAGTTRDLEYRQSTISNLTGTTTTATNLTSPIIIVTQGNDTLATPTSNSTLTALQTAATIPELSAAEEQEFADEAIEELLEETTADTEALELAAGPINETIINPQGDFSYVRISTLADVGGQVYQLSNNDEGNFELAFLDDTQRDLLFGMWENVISEDEDDWVMHYHPDTMRAFGVSRFRMSAVSDIPTTSDFISLVPINTDGLTTTGGTYAALDTQGNLFYTVVCELQDQANKIFLVQDPKTGPATLMRADLRFILTGGVVMGCQYIGFESLFAGYD